MTLNRAAEAYVKYEKKSTAVFEVGWTHHLHTDLIPEGKGTDARRHQNERVKRVVALHGLCHFSDDANLRLG